VRDRSRHLTDAGALFVRSAGDLGDTFVELEDFACWMVAKFLATSALICTPCWL